MTDTFKKIVTMFVVLALLLAVTIVVKFSNLFANKREIEDVDHLSGQRIGVVTAYEGDYLLSDRTDITLLRYDSMTEMLVALCYKQVDAIAETEDMAEYILQVSTGFKINDKPIASNDLASLFTEGSKYMDEFAEFLEVYKASGEYDEYIKRCENNEFYDGSPITEETGTGDVIRIGYMYDCLPLDFDDTINHCPNGSEVEIWRAFANYKNYQIEWVSETETSGLMDIFYKNVDVLLAGYTEVYRKECEHSPNLDMGPAYRESSIILLEVEDYDNIKIGEMPEFE